MSLKMGRTYRKEKSLDDGYTPSVSRKKEKKKSKEFRVDRVKSLNNIDQLVELANTKEKYTKYDI